MRFVRQRQAWQSTPSYPTMQSEQTQAPLMCPFTSTFVASLYGFSLLSRRCCSTTSISSVNFSRAMCPLSSGYVFCLPATQLWSKGGVSLPTSSECNRVNNRNQKFLNNEMERIHDSDVTSVEVIGFVWWITSAVAYGEAKEQNMRRRRRIHLSYAID
jgi:hypothetical protein